MENFLAGDSTPSISEHTLLAQVFPDVQLCPGPACMSRTCHHVPDNHYTPIIKDLPSHLVPLVPQLALMSDKFIEIATLRREKSVKKGLGQEEMLYVEQSMRCGIEKKAECQ